MAANPSSSSRDARPAGAVRPGCRAAPTSPLELMDAAALTREMLEASACAWGAWGDYLQRLAVASGPAAVLDAGARLMADTLEIGWRSAGARLRDMGVDAPLLNDA